MSDKRLRELFSDYAKDGAWGITPDPRAAYAAGSRRRRRRAVVGSLVVVALALAAGIGIDKRAYRLDPATAPHAVADSYPTRLEKPLLRIGSMPTTPGSIAGVIELGTTQESNIRDEWYAVSQTGQLWDFTPGFQNVTTPALSADGTRLGYVGPDNAYVVHDLVTGAVASYPELGEQFRSPQPSGYFLPDQFPSFWSPDNQRLLTLGSPPQGDSDDGLVLSPDGTITAINVAEPGLIHAIGWADSQHIAWLTRHKGLVSLLVTDAAGLSPRSIPLMKVSKEEFISQWSGSMSPDGSLVAIADPGHEEDTIKVFSTKEGALIRTIRQAQRRDLSCGLAWRGNDLAVPVSATEDGGLLVEASGDSHIKADPRLGAACSIWSSTALTGTPHRDLSTRIFGTSTSTLSWHWRQWGLGSTLGVLAVALIIVGFKRLGRRRAADAAADA